MIEFGTLTKDEAIRGPMPWARVVCRDQPPTLTASPSIHPSGLLQWQAAEFDRDVGRIREELEMLTAAWLVRYEGCDGLART